MLPEATEPVNVNIKSDDITGSFVIVAGGLTF